ncbi:MULTISPECIES: hypothetical protein [Hydrocarboniphaga]|jgi:hypothetical protein|nr:MULTISPECIES: hypothetical protein [Hydrocarboniphaga]MDZ4078635.1 hypothetical protein [Hydrocarboniphaga sp.]
MAIRLAIAFAGLLGWAVILIVPFLVSDRAAKRCREEEARKREIRERL